MAKAITLETILGKQHIQISSPAEYGSGAGEALLRLLPEKTQAEVLKVLGKRAHQDKELYAGVIAYAKKAKQIIASQQTRDFHNQLKQEYIRDKDDHDFMNLIRELSGISIIPVILSEENKFMSESEGKNTIKDYIQQVGEFNSSVESIRESTVVKNAKKLGRPPRISAAERARIRREAQRLKMKRKELKAKGEVLRPTQKDIDSVYLNSARNANERSMRIMATLGLEPSAVTKASVKEMQPADTLLSYSFLERILNAFEKFLYKETKQIPKGEISSPEIKVETSVIKIEPTRGWLESKSIKESLKSLWTQHKFKVDISKAYDDIPMATDIERKKERGIGPSRLM